MVVQNPLTVSMIWSGFCWQMHFNALIQLRRHSTPERESWKLRVVGGGRWRTHQAFLYNLGYSSTLLDTCLFPGAPFFLRRTPKSMSTPPVSCPAPASEPNRRRRCPGAGGAATVGEALLGPASPRGPPEEAAGRGTAGPQVHPPLRCDDKMSHFSIQIDLQRSGRNNER